MLSISNPRQTNNVDMNIKSDMIDRSINSKTSAEKKIWTRSTWESNHFYVYTCMYGLESYAFYHEFIGAYMCMHQNNIHLCLLYIISLLLYMTSLFYHMQSINFELT